MATSWLSRSTLRRREGQAENGEVPSSVSKVRFGSRRQIYRTMFAYQHGCGSAIKANAERVTQHASGYGEG